MTAIERTAYPRLKPSLTPSELLQTYSPTEEELAFVQRHTPSVSLQLGLVCLLKCFQCLGYFPPVAEIPAEVIAHLRPALSLLPDVTPGYESLRTLYRHHQAIRGFLGVQPYRPLGEGVATQAIRDAAQTMDHPADLINVAVEELVRQRFELPAFSTLDKLVSQQRGQVNLTFCQRIVARLQPEEQDRLDQLLVRDQVQHRSALAQLREPPGRPTLTQMRRLEERIQWLETLLTPAPLLADIPPGKVKYFAAEARSLQTSDLRDLIPPRRYALLVCLVQQAQVQARDDLVEMFVKRMARIHTAAQSALTTLQEQQRSTTEHLVAVLADIVEQIGEETEDAPLGQQVRQIIAAQGGVEQLREQCATVAAHQGRNYLPLMWRCYRSHRRVLFRLAQRLDLRSTTQDQSLLAALDFVLAHQYFQRDWLPTTLDLSFASSAWQRLLWKRQGDQRLVNRRQLEVCVFSYLATELRSGDVCVQGSEAYADYRTQLLPWEQCAGQVADYCQALTLETTPAGFVQQLRHWLEEVSREVDQSFPTNAHLTFDADGKPHLKRLVRQAVPEGAKELEQALRERMPERQVLDILCNVQHWLNLARAFGPLSGSEPKMADSVRRYVLTLFGYGCNLGPTQMARHARGVASARTLAAINAQHISAAKLDTAIREIINQFNRFELPHFWGSGKRVAADGTQFDLYRNNLLAERHIRYGGYGGIAYYHISDLYIALFSHFISCGVWEAVYILDGLLRNQSDIQPDTIHADTQGQSLPVFGLAYLLGIKLMPRIRTWQDLTFYRPSKGARYQHIDHLFTGVIQWSLLETHWQDLMQVALSIRVGKVLPSMLLRKLGTYSHKNRLYQAFRELGRVVRTVFLLQYISDRPLRQQITATTNKIEAFNSFCQWFFFGGHGIIAHNDPIEQEKRIKYNHLIANSVILQNVVDMTRVLRELAQEGYTVTAETVGVLSPYLTQHIRRFGDYVFDLDVVPEPLELDVPLLLRV